MYVNGDGVNVHPYAFYVDRLVDIQPNAFNAPVNVRLLDSESAKCFADAFDRAADKFAEKLDRITTTIKPVCDAAAGAETTLSHWRLAAEGIGGVALALAVGWFVSHRGHKRERAEWHGGGTQ